MVNEFYESHLVSTHCNVRLSFQQRLSADLVET